MDEHINKNLSERALEDYEHVKLAIAGEQQSFKFLMNRYQNSIYHTMYKMVGNKEDADDLTQEAFSKAFRRLESYQPRFAFSTWLFKIASNNCIDHIRKKRLVLLSIDETIEKEGSQTFSNNLKSNSLNPEQKFIQQQRIKLMRTLMRQLNEKYRLMIELRFFEELSYDEISKELGIPLGTVKAQLFRAKELMYDLLQTPEAKAHIDWQRKKKKSS